MSKIVPVKFGTKSVDIDVEGKKYGELPGILEALNDSEVPGNVEMYADDQLVKDIETSIPEGTQRIEITALAGKVAYENFISLPEAKAVSC